MKPVLRLCSLGLLLVLSLTTVSAANYNYATSIASNGLSMSAYTSATNDSCSVSSTIWFLDKNHESVSPRKFYASQDPLTRMAYISKSTNQLNASLITKVESEHKVGYNTYKSSAYYPGN